MGVVVGVDSLDDSRGHAVAEQARSQGHHANDRRDGARHVLSSHLSNLRGDEYAMEVSLGTAVQQVSQRRQHRRLAALPRPMQNKVALLADQLENSGQVQPSQRWNGVVIGRDNRAFRVEEAHAGSMARLPWLAPFSPQPGTTPVHSERDMRTCHG